MTKSRLQTALEQRERYTKDFDVADFFTAGGTELPRIAMRIPTKAEEIRSIAMAYADAATLTKAAGSSAAEAKTDGDLINELKTVAVLWHACRDADDPKRPAFDHHLWMLDNLDSDQLGTLLRLLEECRKHRGPLPWEVNADQVEAVRQGCVEAWSTDVPERVLAVMDHSYLTTLTVTAMKMWDEDLQRFRRELDERDGKVHPLAEQAMQAMAEDEDEGDAQG